MHRRVALALMGVSIALPRVAWAQPKTAHIALFWIETSRPSSFAAAFIEGLRERGYVVGRDVRIDDRFLVDGYDALALAASRLTAEKPDIIVAYGTTAVQAAHKATKTIPVVVAGASDPVKLGVVTSLPRPGGNVTGIVLMNLDLAGKRMEILKEAFPALRKVAVVFSPQSASEVVQLKNAEAAARTLGLETQPVEVRNASEITAAIEAIDRARIQGIAFVGSTMFRANRERVIAAVARTRLPAMYVDNFFTEAGGLLSYGQDLAENFRRAAIYVDKILKGANPGELPMEQPVRLELIVNLKTARALGLTVPRPVVLRADRIIE